MKLNLIILLALFAAADRSAAQTGIVEIRMHHRVGDKLLLPDSSYVNVFNESFTISKFRYYLSNLLLKGNREFRLPAGSFLVNENEPGSKIIRLTVPVGEYRSIDFLLGVDSLSNISGAQTGALDPLNDMFWTWNTGYVMAKLEGSSQVSRLPQRMIEYHIGGFRGQYSVLRQISLPAPSSQKIKVKRGKTTTVILAADVQKWFAGVHELKLSVYPACTSPGSLAVKFAENYSKMFSIRIIQNP